MDPQSDRSFGNVGNWTVAVSPAAVRFRFAAGTYLFCLLFLVVGVGMLAAGILLKTVLLAIMGAVFAVAGALLLRSACRRKFPEFDLVQELFYPQGRALSLRELDVEADAVPFREMQGFRLNAHMEGSGKNSHRVFILELLCSGNRSYRLLRRSDFGAFWCEAVALSRALGLPLPAPDEAFRKMAKGARRGQLFLALFGMCFFAVSLVFAYFCWVQGLLAMLRSDGWVKVPATVRRSEVKRSGSGKNTSYRALIDYQYHYRGRNFSGSACDFWDNVSSGRGSAEALCRKYPAGSSCECWVDPAEPDHAVLSRAWPDRITLAALLLGVFHLVGLGLAATGLRQLCRRVPGFPDAGRDAEKEGKL